MVYWTFNDFFELIFLQGEKLNFIFGFSLIQNEKVKSRYTYILLDLVMLKVLQYLLTEQGHFSQSCSCSQSWFTVTGSFSFQKRISLTRLIGLTNT